MMRTHTDHLRESDVVVKLDDHGKIIDTTTLKMEVPTLGCTGRHFITVANSLVCYGRGIVTIRNRYGN